MSLLSTEQLGESACAVIEELRKHQLPEALKTHIQSGGDASPDLYQRYLLFRDGSPQELFDSPLTGGVCRMALSRHGLWQGDIRVWYKSLEGK